MWPRELPNLYQNFKFKKNVKSFLLFILDHIYAFRRKREMSKKILKNIFECPLCKDSLLAEGEYFQCKKCTIIMDKNENANNFSK